MDDPFLHAQDLPPVYEDALDFTGFALDQFRERADRDGAALVILSTHSMGTRGDLAFDRLTALAEPRGIPIIDQYDYIARQGAEPTDAIWEHDGHWNAAGHRWAAEALLEYLKENQAICTTRKRPTAPPPSWLTTIESGELAARSVFDGLYRREHGGLPQVAVQRGGCASGVLPASRPGRRGGPAGRSPAVRLRQYAFSLRGTRRLAFGGQCIAERTLPDYPIARIRTGQFTPEGDLVWMAAFPVGAVEGEPSWLTDYESVASGEPAARSVFDVYAGENTVVYLKSPCSVADVQAEFFLHVVPEDLKDLPADRRQHGFGGGHFRYGEYAALDFGGPVHYGAAAPRLSRRPHPHRAVQPRRRPHLDGRVPRRRGGRRTVAMTRAGMKTRRALRLVGWNALFLVAGLALIGVVGEAYFRLQGALRGDVPSLRLVSKCRGDIRAQVGGALDEQA